MDNWIFKSFNEGETRPRCPLCNAVLAEGQQRRHETLSEHVSDPNCEYPRPVRPTLECYNPDCAVSGKGFWSPFPDGGWYSNPMWKTNNIPHLGDRDAGTENGEPCVEPMHDVWYRYWKQQHAECIILRDRADAMTTERTPAGGEK